MNTLIALTEEQEQEVLRLWYTGNEAANTIAAEMNITTEQALAVINNARVNLAKAGQKK